MALTYGFYNSIDGDRLYDAIQFGRIFDGIITDGVYATYEKGMMVIASENPSEVIIQPGRAWFNHTWNYNDANIIMEAPSPEVLLDRIDALVLEINEELSVRGNTFKWVLGTPSSRPERPTLTNTTTIHQYPLCYVRRYPETTMIYTRDITNMIGTSECPFATGVLEGIDLDAWINQWDDEFHSWENTTKTGFEAWMLAQESAFTVWYNAFKDQMAGDVQEVEDFVAYLESVLDASTAVHLQEEIDELKTEITSGSQITVTTINSELYNRNVTITEPAGTVLTEKFDSTGVATFKSVPYVGNLTISSTYGQQTAQRVVNTPYYARYSFAIAFWAATVNIVGDPEMAGYSVTVKDGDGTIVGTVVLDENATGVYTAIKPDTYKFSITYGEETMEVTLSVTQETTYTVTLHAAPSGFDYEEWLEAGGVTGSYASLDEVLADEEALRRLCLVHASVDYMCGFEEVDENLEKIINTDLFAKWVNNSDYALDNMYANEAIADKMDTADKYGYGEWCLMPQVPTMTSNTTPYGVCSGENIASNIPAYYAFDGSNSTHSRSSNNNTSYLEYTFSNPTIVKMFTVLSAEDSSRLPRLIKIAGSSDGTSFRDIYTFNNTIPTLGVPLTDNIENNDALLSIRLYFKRKDDLTSYDASITSLQFYAWAPKGNVPIMTSNTAPYGTASATSQYNANNAPYMAFDGSDSTTWASSSNTNQRLSYQFTNPVNVRFVKFVNRVSTPTQIIKDYKIQYSDDGSTWYDAVDETLTNQQVEVTTTNISDKGYHLYWGLLAINDYGSTNISVISLQFYGRELSVSVPVMTGNTTPYGEASASNTYDTYYPWKAFDGTNGNGWFAYAQGEWVEYDFQKPIKVEMITYGGKGPGSKAVTTYPKFQGYDGTNWDDLTNEIEFTIPTATTVLGKVASMITSGVYQKYRMILSSESSNHDGNGFKAQFYGKDYSEKEFEVGATRKWLYDHGLELETMEIVNQGQGFVIKNPSDIYVEIPATTKQSANYYAQVDLTPYSLLRAKVSDNFYAATASYGPGFIAVYTQTPNYSNAGLISSCAPLMSDSSLPNNLSIDVSSVVSTNYVSITTANANGAILKKASFKEFWLE